MLDHKNEEILDGSTEFIENKIKSYLEQGCNVTILQDKNLTETRRVVKIKVEEKEKCKSI